VASYTTLFFGFSGSGFTVRPWGLGLMVSFFLIFDFSIFDFSIYSIYRFFDLFDLSIYRFIYITIKNH